MTIANKTYLATDITPGAIAILHGISPVILVQLVQELVELRDIDNLTNVLSSDIVLSDPWKDLCYQMLPLKDSDDPRARAMFKTWMDKMSGLDVEKLTERLVRVTETTLNNCFDHTKLQAETRQLVRLGANIEELVGPSNRTPLGNALLLHRNTIAEMMIREFSVLHPDRLPLAAKGIDVCSFILANHNAMSGSQALISKIADLWDFRQDKLKESYTKPLLKLLTPNLFVKIDMTIVGLILQMAAKNMVHSSALHTIWSGAYFSGGRLRLPGLMGQSYFHAKDIDTFSALDVFIKSGIDINAPLGDGRLPVAHVMEKATPAFVSHFLNSGVDAAALRDSMRNNPDQYSGVPTENMILANAFIAHQSMMNVLSASRPNFN